MDASEISMVISIISLMISLAVLFIHYKNRKTTLHSYWINRNVHRYSASEMTIVRTIQQENSYFAHLVYFNPGSVASILQSLTVYRQVKYKLPFLPFFLKDWEEITEAKWWPTESPDDFNVKFIADEYTNLYVEDYRDILVVLPGRINRGVHRFHIKTNQGGFYLHSTPGLGNENFAHSSNRTYRD